MTAKLPRDRLANRGTMMGVFWKVRDSQVGGFASRSLEVSTCWRHLSEHAASFLGLSL